MRGIIVSYGNGDGEAIPCRDLLDITHTLHGILTDPETIYIDSLMVEYDGKVSKAIKRN